jgi:hypothetical protein
VCSSSRLLTGRAHPNGRLVVVGFAEPALPAGGQGLDEWLLNTTHPPLAAVARHAANVALKFTSMNWTSDGRKVELPERSGGSDSFVVWCQAYRRPAARDRFLNIPFVRRMLAS